MNAAEIHTLGLRLYEAERFDEALALLRQALGDAESSELWSDWSTVQFRRGETGEAEAGYRIALQMNPNETQAAANLGAMLMAQGRSVEGLALLERGLGAMTPEQRAATQLKIMAGRQSGQGNLHDRSQTLEQFLRLYVSEDANERSYFETHIKRYFATLEALPDGQSGERLLELGAAFHHLTPALIHCKGYEDVRCTDVWEGEPSSKRVLASSDGKFRDEVIVDNFDLQTSPWPYADGGFDVVLCCEILEHLALDPMALMAEMNRVLKPGGTLLLTTPNLGTDAASGESLLLWPIRSRRANHGPPQPRIHGRGGGGACSGRGLRNRVAAHAGFLLATEARNSPAACTTGIPTCSSRRLHVSAGAENARRPETLSSPFLRGQRDPERAAGGTAQRSTGRRLACRACDETKRAAGP